MEKKVEEIIMQGVLLSTGFRGLSLPARIGVYESEKAEPQELLIDLKMHYAAAEIPAVIGAGELDLALDYARAAEVIRARIDSAHHDLLEFLAGKLLSDLRDNFPTCSGIELRLEKPSAIPGSNGSFCEINWRSE